MGFPELGRKIYICDGSQGDGGVRWWTSGFMEIPIQINGVLNPDGNLVLEYWPSVRQKIENSLIK